MLKILQARLQKYMSHKLPDVQAGFRKGKETEIKLPTFVGSWKKQESSRRTSTPASLTMPKSLYGSQQTVVNSSRDGNTRPPDLPLEKPICMSGTNSYNWTWNNKLVPKGQGCILSPCLFNFYAEYIMKNTGLESKHKLESRLPGEIPITSDMQMTPPLWQKVKRN